MHFSQCLFFISVYAAVRSARWSKEVNESHSELCIKVFSVRFRASPVKVPSTQLYWYSQPPTSDRWRGSSVRWQTKSTFYTNHHHLNVQHQERALHSCYSGCRLPDRGRRRALSNLQQIAFNSKPFCDHSLPAAFIVTRFEAYFGMEKSLNVKFAIVIHFFIFFKFIYFLL